MTLPVRYNYFTNYRYFRIQDPGVHVRGIPGSGRTDTGMGKAPVIIHYLGDERPWIAENHNHFRRLYEYYLDKTPGREPQSRRERGCTCTRGGCLTTQALSALPSAVDQPHWERVGGHRRKQKALEAGNDMDKISMIILNYNDSYTTLSLVDEVRGL